MLDRLLQYIAIGVLINTLAIAFGNMVISPGEDPHLLDYISMVLVFFLLCCFWPLFWGLIIIDYLFFRG